MKDIFLFRIFFLNHYFKGKYVREQNKLLIRFNRGTEFSEKQELSSKIVKRAGLLI